MPHAPDVVRLAGDHLALGLALGIFELLALPLDPRQPLNHCEAHLLVIKSGRSRNANPADRRIHPDMEVLDVLVDDMDIDPGDG